MRYNVRLRSSVWFIKSHKVHKIWVQFCRPKSICRNYNVLLKLVRQGEVGVEWWQTIRQSQHDLLLQQVKSAGGRQTRKWSCQTQIDLNCSHVQTSPRLAPRMRGSPLWWETDSSEAWSQLCPQCLSLSFPLHLQGDGNEQHSRTEFSCLTSQ